MNNWFWFTVALQQIGGSIYCLFHKDWGWSILLFMYGLTNIILFYLQKGGAK